MNEEYICDALTIEKLEKAKKSLEQDGTIPNYITLVPRAYGKTSFSSIITEKFISEGPKNPIREEIIYVDD